MAPESINLDSFTSSISMFSYPCMRLICERNFQNSITKRFPSEGDALTKIFVNDLFGGIDESDLSKSKGLLNSLKFEDFVRRLSPVERRWSASFRTW